MDSIASSEMLERWSIEFKKGFAKPMILLFLKQKENYPYSLTREINSRTRGAINIAGSNIYPLLGSMKKQGLISSTKSKDGTRTMYQLSIVGENYLQSLQTEIIDFLNMILSIIQEEEK
ncbi:MAG: PadR family transcriptional regulator [Candidatus Kariarchaeaceae archaeon]|jgi:DNA-binding PadR family transcriptional regulator